MQTHNKTEFNRYPFLWNQIKDEQVSSILSFGCSTGEEAVTAQAYFPDAYVKGYDTNPVMIRIANLRFDQGFTDSFDEVKENSYDLILCNSVLCNHPKNFKADKNEVMDFDYFEATLKMLDSILNPNGILMAMNTEYIVSDVLDYEPIGVKYNHYVAVFDKFGYKTTHKQFALWRKG